MARILAYTTPGRGHLFPLVPILAELRRRGHQVALRTLAAGWRRCARGFDAAPISDRVEAIAHDDWRAGNPRAALARAATGRPTSCWSAPATGTRRPTRQAGWRSWTGRSCWSPPRRSSRTTPGWSRSRWRRWPTSPWPWWPPLPAADPTGLQVPATRVWSGSSPTGRCWTAPPAPSPTAAWAPPRRPWPTACRSVSSPSDATSWRSPGGCGPPAPAPGCRHGACAPTACGPRSAKPSGCGTGARRIQEAFAAAGGPAAAVDAFETRLLNRQKLRS